MRENRKNFQGENIFFLISAKLKSFFYKNFDGFYLFYKNNNINNFLKNLIKKLHFLK